MAEPINYRILFVEDVPTDNELAKLSLKAEGIGGPSLRVDTREDFLAALSSFEPEIVISDYSMPTFDGMTALKLSKSLYPLLPFIILTGSMNEDVAVECMKAGASDYVIKEHMARLPFAVREAMRSRESRVEAMRSAEQLRESDERYRSLFEGSPAVMLIVDPGDGAIAEVNEAAIEFYGWSREEFRGKKMGQINVMGDDAVKSMMDRTVATGRMRFEARHRLSNGDVRDVEVHSGLNVLGGKTFLFSIIHDISARVAATRERDDLSARLSHYLATSPTVTYSLRIKGGAARWQWASENIGLLLGYKVDEVLGADWWMQNVHPADRMRALGGISKLTGTASFGQEYRFLRKDRSTVWLRDEMRFVESSGGESEIVGTLTDVTDRKKMEVELSQKSAALEAAANAIVITDREGRIQWLNQAFSRLTGYSREEAVGEAPGSLLASGEQDRAFYSELWDSIIAGRVWQGQLVNKRKDGSRYTEEMTITPVLDDTNRVSNFIAIKTDVTEREESRTRLVASLAEKEELLSEIHHRNYNTMQLIISLLQLSVRELRDERLEGAIDGISRRILAIAQVHELFYSSEDMAHIDFATYLQRCADDLRVASPGYLGALKVQTGGAPVKLSLGKAIPAGLVASELLANALQHAFPRGSEKGSIDVSLRRKGAEIELIVRDDGVGMAGGSPGLVGTLGMTLIRILTDQLDGTMEFRSSLGTEAIIRFAAD